MKKTNRIIMSCLIALLTSMTVMETALAAGITGTTDCSIIPVYPAGRGTYKGGDRVQNKNEIYECKAWPFDGWANSPSTAYEPGVGFAWQDAWIDIGPCTGGTNIAPTVTLSSPTTGSTFTDITSIAISANAADADGTVTQVEFFQGSQSIAVDNTSPYSVNWSSIASGTYSLTAVATDNKGAKTTSATVNVTFKSSTNTPPTASITSPTSGATFAPGANIAISASAADADGTVSQVEFFQGTQSLGVDNSSPYSVIWNNVATGNYSLTAIATDNKSAKTTSTAILITVQSSGGDCGGLPVYPVGIGTYVGGTRVSYNNNIYECKAWPFSGWANASNSAYVPGTGSNWQDAWIYIGPCGGDTQTPPAAPENLNTTALSSSQISLSWTDKSNNETAFRIERSTNGTNWTSLTTVAANTTSYIDAGLTKLTTYYYHVRAENAKGNSSYTASSSAKTLDEGTSTLPTHIMSGYWHSWGGGVPFIKLKDVNPNWNVINISFAEPITAGSTDGQMKFAVTGYTDAEFRADVKTMQAQGKKIVLSIGGYEGYFSLGSAASVTTFVNAIKGYINSYGFDGIDIDLEQSSLQFNGGADPDFKNPTSPKIVNMISALKQITSSYTSNFILSFAPETFYFQMGHQFYGGLNGNVDTRSGVYIPVIHALRDKITYVQAQLYNSIAILGNDGVTYSMGNAAATVAMCKMVIEGFTLNGNSSYFFPGLRPDQVVIGVPASASAAGSGQISNAELQQAFSTLVQSYPTFRGIMSWSINWDAYQNNNSFVISNRNYLNGLPTVKKALVEVGIINNPKIGLLKLSNYPNPFNAATTINYSISQRDHVSLKVLNVLGEEVATLVNLQQDAGEYYVNFNASKLKSGIYYYKLKAGNFIETQKMLIVK